MLTGLAWSAALTEAWFSQLEAILSSCSSNQTSVNIQLQDKSDCTYSQYETCELQKISRLTANATSRDNEKYHKKQEEIDELNQRVVGKSVVDLSIYEWKALMEVRYHTVHGTSSESYKASERLGQVGTRPGFRFSCRGYARPNWRFLIFWGPVVSPSLRKLSGNLELLRRELLSESE